MKMYNSLQEVFDKVSNHLLQQGKRASLNPEDNRSQCRYRTGNGLTCAVGCLIPEDKYSSDIEGKCVTQPEIRKILIELIDEKIYSKALSLLASLQNIHDLRNPDEWKHELEFLATYKKLKVNFD